MMNKEFRMNLEGASEKTDSKLAKGVNKPAFKDYQILKAKRRVSDRNLTEGRNKKVHFSDEK